MDRFLTFRVEIPGAVFLIVIVAAIVFMIIAMFQFRRIRHQEVNAVASILIVIGVLGTFVGITLGLLAFDAETVETIEDSIPQLLGGLRIAFVTSILGIFTSIIFKWRTLNNRRKEAISKDAPSGATLDDLASLLEDIRAVEQNEGKATRETLHSIERSLTGEGDATVLSQIQKLGATISNKQDELICSFNEFAKRMADDNTNALIQALEEVMRDFNAKINEQFGDNFRQLNEAVGRVNQWQEQYREQMDELAIAFRITTEGMEKSRQSLEIISEHSGTIVSSAEKLNPILQAIQHQIEQLDEHLEAFNTLTDNARNAFPIIEGRLNQLTDNFSSTVKETIDNSHASMQSQHDALSDFLDMVRESIENSNSHMERQRSNLQDFTEQIKKVIQNTSSGLENTLEETDRGLRITLQSYSTQLSDEVKRIFAESSERMTDQIENLDDALGQELTKALNLLGNELASLSEKFVEDYNPLTDRLREVVQIANRLPRTRSYDTSDDIPF